MRTNNHNSDIRKLEAELRKLDAPYVSSEPEPLYWANFRVRLMDRIESEHKPAFSLRVKEFIASHIMASSIAASAACLIVAAVFYFQPAPSEIAAVQPDAAAVQPLASVPESVKPASPVVQPGVKTAHVSESLADANVKKHRLNKMAEPIDPDMAANVPIATDDEHPVSLEELSQPELEAVLNDIQNQNSQNQE